ncbi:MAG: DUF4838 domain-containing protein [Armatimonadetes bacterium]|nr:DUF4838 domain-containing protein [Armatimonadota bacterium]
MSLSRILPTCLLAGALGPRVWALTLAEQGRTGYTIVIPSEAIEPERTAAGELKEYLQKVTGAQFRIRTESEVPNGARQILVGPSRRLKKLTQKTDWTSLGHDGIVIKTVGKKLLLAGGRPRGTLYAVYTFLEEVVGCRWWTSTEDYIPKKPTLTIPALDKTHVPPLRYREAFYRDAFRSPFAVRMKTNGHFEQIPPEYGGHYNILGWCHTFYQLLPPDKYFSQHPDWYSEINGNRVPEGAQLCLTNEEMRKELTRQALEWIRKSPDAGMISIAQNDCGGRCQCAKCAAVEKEEGAPSGPLIHFVNAVATDIEKEYPDFLVETLAYQYTRQAPLRVKPRANVVVRLCTIECSFAQPLSSDQNAKFRDDIKAWSAVAPNLYIWDYVTDFANYLQPHPNLRVLAPNLRFFVEHHAIGVFEQGDAGCAAGDFVRLRAWLLAHLLWDPSLDEKALLKEFLEGYYGPAAPFMSAYLDLVNDAAERATAYVSCFTLDTSYLRVEDLQQARALFDQAAATVKDDPVLSQRVRRERLPLDHLWLTRYFSLKRLARSKGLPFPGPQNPVEACEEFLRVAKEFNVGNYNEGQSFESYEPTLRSRFRPAGPPPEQCQGLPEDDWVDLQDNQFTLYGALSQIVDDLQASDGKAARMPGNHIEWATQYPIDSDLEGKWHCYVVVRCEAKAQHGNAFTCGIWDANQRLGVMQRTEAIETAGDGKYHTVDLGVRDLKSGMYFWLAPPGDAASVTAVYTDRIFLIREKG